MTRRTRPIDPLAVTFAILSLVVLAAFAGGLLGKHSAATQFSAICEAGETFYKLGTVDVPYRCARVIDYPPTTGDTE